VAVSTDTDEISVYTRSARAFSDSWEREVVRDDGRELINPRIFSTTAGTMLFASQRPDDVPDSSAAPLIVYSFRFSDGDFGDVMALPVGSQDNVFNPWLLEYSGRYFVAYESRRVISNTFFTGFTNQIYLIQSADNGRSWSEEPLLLTGFVDADETHNPDFATPYLEYLNQNPRLSLGLSGQPVMTLDRNRQGGNPRAALIRFDGSFNIIPVRDERRNEVEALYYSEANRPSSVGNFILFNGREYLSYYYDVEGNSTVFFSWVERDRIRRFRLNEPGSIAYLPQILNHNFKLHAFWLRRQSSANDVSSLNFRPPDISVDPPILRALSFTPGVESNRTDVQFRVDLPSDPAGISDIRYAWSQDDSVASDSLVSIGDERQLQLEALEHGDWNLFVQLRDGAGNASPITILTYELDLIPPDPVRFGRLPLDEDGYVLSNTISIPWQQNAEEDLAGYRLSLAYLGGPDAEFEDPDEILSLAETAIQTSAGALREENRLELFNQDNGTWALAVQAVDRVGNVGEPGIQLLRFNKFIPFTRLSFIDLSQDILGRNVLEFTGRGFTANGLIRSIIFDRDQREPWDYILTLAESDYRIDSDRRISQIILENFSSGDYYIVLEHSERGLYFHPRQLAVDANGAVRFGDYRIFSPREVIAREPVWFSVSFSNLAVFTLSLVSVLAIIISLVRIRSIIIDSRVLQAEVRALVSGAPRFDSEEIQGRLRSMKVQGVGLRAKFTLFMLILVISVVAVVAIPLSNFVLSTQRETLAQGLEDRVSLVMESLALGAAEQFDETSPSDIADGLVALSNQTEAVDEIEYVTITGQSLDDILGGEPDIGSAELDRFEYIWATTDELITATPEDRANLLQDVDEELASADYFQRYLSEFEEAGGAAEGFILFPGEERISDRAAQIIDSTVFRSFNDIKTNNEIRQIVEDLIVIGSERIGADSEQLRQSVANETIRRNDLANLISQNIVLTSTPAFSVSEYSIDSRYFTFVYPIYSVNTVRLDQPIPREGNDLSQEEISTFVAANYDQYYPVEYLGSIRLGVSTENINENIANTTRAIIIQILIFAAIAIGAGIAGAFLLASLTVNPINKLVAGVERIRDTEKIVELKDSPIVVKTKDELNFLSETINQMTEKLIKAEKANESMMMGKDTQKMYISLDQNPFEAEKKSSFLKDLNKSKYLEFGGYYEGAKEVSGDYFYYDRIDDEHFAMIKCDVSGKDIMAALIMVTVASLFLKTFEGWSDEYKKNNSSKRKGYEKELKDFATSVNDIIYRRQFGGKFAAFNALTLNEKTGEMRFCNAGDNLVHIYRRTERRVITIELPQPPAAGVLHEELVGMPIDFPIETGRIEPGDILLLFTDGLDEGRRYLRYDDWSIYKESEFKAPDSASEEQKEEMDAKRKKLEKAMEPMLLGQDEGGLGEAFSVPRLIEVIEAIMNRQVYELKKFRNPAKEEELIFDFSDLDTSLENLVIAVMSVEKVYRLVPLPDLTSENQIKIDKKIDDFLKQHFLQYGNYFHHQLPEEEKSLYRRYSHIYEDSQYDDLTILAVEKKEWQPSNS
jgi:serine phosphatase RsbU (regulator of sigma subunit)